jgi:hypothetical protein
MQLLATHGNNKTPIKSQEDQIAVGHYMKNRHCLPYNGVNLLTMELMAELRPSGWVLDTFRISAGGTRLLNVEASLYDLLPQTPSRGGAQGGLPAVGHRHQAESHHVGEDGRTGPGDEEGSFSP